MSEEPRKSGPQPPASPDLITVIVVALALAAGLALRWWVLRSPLGSPDFDEATVGLQAAAFLRGDLEVYFANQPYGGTLETAVVALLSVVLPGPDLWALKLTPILANLLAAGLIWRVSRRLCETPLGQMAAPVALWLGSAYGIWWSTKERGFYGVSLVIAAATLLLVVRINERRSPEDTALLGLCFGLGIWTAPLLLAALVPPIAWLALRRAWLWSDAPLAACFAALGAAPALVWNAFNDWESAAAPTSMFSTWGERLADGFERLPVLVGLATPFDPARAAVPAALAIALVVGMLAVATYRTRDVAPGLVAVSVAGYIVVHSFNGLATVVGEDARYLYALLPALALAFGVAVDALPAVGERWPAAGVAGVTVGFTALSVWALQGLIAVSEQTPPDRFLASPGLERVVDRLVEEEVEAVTTDITGTQVAFLSGGAVEAGSYEVPRFAAMEEAAAEKGRCTYVLRIAHDGDRSTGRLESYLATHQVPHFTEEIGTFRIYWLAEPVAPWQANLDTFWGPVRKVPGETVPTTC